MVCAILTGCFRENVYFCKTKPFIQSTIGDWPESILHPMIINYQYWNLQFLTPGQTPLRNDAIMFDDSDLKRCFDCLVDENRNVAVRCTAGSARRLWHYLMQQYKYVKAAGGVVTAEDGRLLIMTRNGRADQPKGMVEAGETLQQAALRETNEETGLVRLHSDGLLLKSYHIYNLYGGWHLKQTSWFALRGNSGDPFKPQLEEGVTAVQWVDSERWRTLLGGSYATMDVLARQMSAE